MLKAWGGQTTQKVKRESDITGKPIPHGINNPSFAVGGEVNGKIGV